MRFTTKLSFTVLIAFLALAAATAQTPTPAASTQSLVFQDQPDSKSGDIDTHPAQTENWTALAIADSGIPPMGINAVVLSTIDQPTYTRELVRVQWRLGDPIDLYVVIPKGRVKPQPILYLYDYRYDTDRFRNERWCELTTKDGFAAIGFVSALAGQRFHSPRPLKEWFVSELQEALGSSTHDVQMVLNYLSTRGDLDVSRVGMYGEGSGGAVAILAASVEPRIVALDLLNPWGDWPDFLKDSPQIPTEERATYLKPAFLQGVAGLDPVTYLPHLKIKALRIQQIMDDLIIPAAAKDKIALAAPNPEDVVRYPDSTGHLNAWKRHGITGWFSDELQPTSQVVKKAQ